MAQIQKLESQQFELKCSADKFFGFYKNNIPQLVKLFPENYRSIQVLQGDGSVGTVRLWKLIQEGAPNDVVAKEKVTAVDEKNRSITYSTIEGDLMNHYDSFDIKLSVTPKGGSGSAGGCLVKWSVEYEKKTEEFEGVPSPKDMIDLMGKITKGTDAHLLKA